MSVNIPFAIESPASGCISSPAAARRSSFYTNENRKWENRMSWLKAIAGGVIGAEALSLIKQYVEKEGGLDAVVKNFQNGGYKRQVDSWISTSKNQAISGIEVGQAIGIEKIKKLAESAGIDVNKARDLLAEYLPIAIDKATPEGKLPAPEEGDAKKSLY
jgi:uncharacterized protein YidB (DUF937 family)